MPCFLRKERERWATPICNVTGICSGVSTESHIGPEPSSPTHQPKCPSGRRPCLRAAQSSAVRSRPRPHAAPGRHGRPAGRRTGQGCPAAAGLGAAPPAAGHTPRTAPGPSAAGPGRAGLRPHLPQRPSPHRRLPVRSLPRPRPQCSGAQDTAGPGPLTMLPTLGRRCPVPGVSAPPARSVCPPRGGKLAEFSVGEAHHAAGVTAGPAYGSHLPGE